MTEQILSYIVSILAGLAVCIPLVIKLVNYVKAAVQEKNWVALIGLLIDLMEEAESKFNDGATRKEWVVAMVKTSAEYINYKIDDAQLSSMIDALCDMTKVINAGETDVTVISNTGDTTGQTTNSGV